MPEVLPLPNHSYPPDSFEWIACEGGPAAVWRAASSRTREYGDRSVARTPKAERLITEVSREPDHVRAAIAGGVDGVASSLRSSGQPEWLANSVLAENFAHMPLLSVLLRTARTKDPGDLPSTAWMAHLSLRELVSWRISGDETDERWEFSRGQWRPINVPMGLREQLRKHAEYLRSSAAPRSGRGRPLKPPYWSNRALLVYQDAINSLLPGVCMAVPNRAGATALCREVVRAGPDELQTEAAELLRDIQSGNWDDPHYRIQRWGRCTCQMHRRFMDLRMMRDRPIDCSADADVSALVCEIAAGTVPVNRMPDVRRWSTVTDLANLHARLIGQLKPEICVIVNRPAGSTHDFLCLVGQLYRLADLVPTQSADYVHRIGVN